ncbi:uncharacterized protein METZ01_LOCUS423354, partial [marine metagenome]
MSGLMAANWDWGEIQSFLEDFSVRLQLAVIGGLLCVSYLATRLTRWRIHPLAENPDSPPLLCKGWAAMERMVAPLYLLLLCLLTIVFFYKFHQPKQDLI